MWRSSKRLAEKLAAITQLTTKGSPSLLCRMTNATIPSNPPLTDAGEKSLPRDESHKLYIYAFGDRFLCRGRLRDGGLRKGVPGWSSPTLRRHGRRSPFHGGVVHHLRHQQRTLLIAPLLPLHYSSPMTCTSSRLGRGPSSSTKNTLCQVPSCSLPSFIGMDSLAPRSIACMCAWALSSISSCL